MNLQQLEYALAVARLGSFTKAAEYCNVTQATLSVMIKKLEDELDVVIFDRKRNPILVTEIGSDILKDCEVIVAQSHVLKKRTQKEPLHIEGHFVLAVIPTIANSLLPHIVEAVIRNFPKITLEIIEITTQDILKRLKEGSIDAGVLATPIVNEDMEAQVLYYETLLVYGCQQHNRKFLMPGDISKHKIWLLEEAHCFREQQLNICSLRPKKNGPQNLKFEASSFETLLNMVDIFGGLTVIPELYCHGLSPERKESLKRFGRPMPVREVSMIYHRPYAKKHIIEQIGKLIQDIILPLLQTNKYRNSDLSIINAF